ncbi:hypothetical protein PHYPSEUDO_002344 [Phytophthora pseudosyringae]|uniref:Uncharacterized protein n=1 Tax=Phytophthora pseudosyringae TaxID=221518 RepID=A0A8T1WJB4_9STRA|nr:hypothetical protein PHYPSEUDO_002344 [Phytophthora pseudosyringae]
MEIVAVDRWLLQLAAIDEDESEAVAISCVEFLLSETNAQYQQKCLATEAVRSVSARLGNNVLDTVFAAALEAEIAVGDARFRPESRPEAESKDRHAVRSVPSRSPEKHFPTLGPKTSSAPASRVGSSPEKLRSHAGVSPTRRRRKSVGKDKASAPPVQIMEREGDVDDEKPEIKAWRDKCLKSLEASARKPGFTKWVKMARVFSVPESRVSMEVGVINAPPPNVVEALAATPVRMKTNVDSFSSIVDGSDDVGQVPATTRRPSRRFSMILDPTARSLQPMSAKIHSIAENPHRQSKRRSQSASVNDSALPQQRKSTLLTDSLSRRKLTRNPSSTESLSGNSNCGWNSSRSLWRYEQEAGSATSRTFAADGSEFSATALPATMSVASGVVLLQGESVVEGPEWVDGATTMSRKRFDLQQRLATDALLNTNSERDLQSPRGSSLGSPLQLGHYPASPLSELHFRDYEEVPPEPIPIPQLSPISTSTLAIPRTHLTSSLSTPSLRVRTSTTSGKAGGSLNNSMPGENGSNRSVCTDNSSNNGHTALGNLQPRPTTALRAIAAPPKLVSGRARATSAASGGSRTAAQSMKSTGTASAKYLREFPKPKPGVIRVVSDQATALLGSVDDHQRTAWMS